MAAATALDHTGLTVRDLERSLVFYRDLLGFELELTSERRGGAFAAIVGYPDAHARLAILRLPGSEHRLELFQYLSPPGLARPSEPRAIGLTHVSVLVEGIESLCARLRAAGAELLSDAVAVDGGRGGSACYVRDPDGTIVELHEPGESA